MHSFLLNILIQFLPNLRFISLKKSQINIDFTCAIDGEESEDYSDTDYDLIIGSGDSKVYLVWLLFIRMLPEKLWIKH